MTRRASNSLRRSDDHGPAADLRAVCRLSLSLYVMLDGFDLGVGALLLVQPDEQLRDRMVDSIMPTWDGNETWLIMAGVALLAAFPIAYGVLLPAFYLPLIAMLLALGLRGVSFEFRYQVDRQRRLWDSAFGVGSIVAALEQGLIVGGLIQGVAVDGERFAAASSMSSGRSRCSSAWRYSRAISSLAPAGCT